MTKSNSGKWVEWQKRLDKFEASGLTVAQFCRQSDVTPHTFYYWKRRLGRSASKRRRGATRRPVDRQTAEEVSITTKDVAYSGPQVVFTWGSTLRIAVPAHCMDTIRCVLECAGRTEHEPGESARSFQELVLAE